MRKSSKASSWLPEGEGYKVFESSPPEGPPPIAAAKSDATWGRPAIEATIRAWFGFMAVDSHALKSIKEEWEALFASLPPSTDASGIPAEQQLQWHPLPSRVFANRDRVRVALPDEFDGVTDALENPPINPITGNGRTTAEVNHDRVAYQAYVRAAPTDHEPVFQADYLFVQAPGHSIQLHRVVSGLFIENATAPGICFQTLEYVQTANPHIGGFWGEFTPKPNPSYLPGNKKLGTRYVRHNEISRAHIKLYNVGVVRVVKPPRSGQQPVAWIRVDARSLDRLAEEYPEFPAPAPDACPDSHYDDQRLWEQDEDNEEFGSSVDSTEEEDEDEDPPPVFPAGFRAAADTPSPLVHFVIWSSLNGANSRAQWCTGKVVKTYPPGFTYRGKPYTHDAKLAGTSEVRGVNLTDDLRGALAPH